jgi:hypothetical protein
MNFLMKIVTWEINSKVLKNKFKEYNLNNKISLNKKILWREL